MRMEVEVSGPQDRPLTQIGSEQSPGGPCFDLVLTVPCFQTKSSSRRGGPVPAITIAMTIYVVFDYTAPTITGTARFEVVVSSRRINKMYLFGSHLLLLLHLFRSDSAATACKFPNHPSESS